MILLKKDKNMKKFKIKNIPIRRMIISAICIILALIFLLPFLTIFADEIDETSNNPEIVLRATLVDSPKYIEQPAFHLEVWNKTEKEINLFIKSSGFSHKSTFNLSKNREDEEKSSFYNKNGNSIITIKPNLYKKDPMNIVYTFSNKNEKIINYSFAINSGENKDYQSLVDDSNLFNEISNSFKWKIYTFDSKTKNNKSKSIYGSTYLKDLIEYTIKPIVINKNITQNNQDSKSEKLKEENDLKIENNKSPENIQEENINKKSNEEENKDIKGNIIEMIKLLQTNKYAMIGAVAAGTIITGGVSYLIYRFNRHKEYVDIYNFEDKEYYED